MKTIIALSVLIALCVLNTEGAAIERGVSMLFHQCPMVMCMMVGNCDPKTYVHSTFTFDGMECAGCSHCPVTAQTREAIHPFMMCPMVMCMAPGDCDPKTYIHHTLKFADMECPGCASCPLKVIE